MTDNHQQRQQIAKDYASKRRLFTVIEFVLIAVLFVLAFVFSKNIASLVESWPAFFAGAVYFIILAAAYFVILFPVHYMKNYKLPKDFGLLKISFSSWFMGHLRLPVLVFLLGGAAFGLLHVMIAASPNWWWLWAALAVMAFSFIISALYPLIALPLMYKTHPMQSGPLKEAVQAVIDKSGLTVSGVDIIEVAEEEDSSNAMLMGMGKTRKIGLTDTLLKEYDADEIEVIVAHELGHVKMGHFAKSFIFSCFATLIVLLLTHFIASWLISAFDMGTIATLSAMPLIVLVFFVLYSFSMVFSNIYSRYQEKDADLYSLKLTDKPDAFMSMLKKITDQNLDEASAEEIIEKLMYDHPSYDKRMSMAQAYKDGHYNSKQ